MEILVNGQAVKTITDTEYKIITHTIAPDEFQQDMERRYLWAKELQADGKVKWTGEDDKFKNPVNCIIQLKINNNIYQLRKEWQSRIQNPALDNMEFCEQVFAHPDYINRGTEELIAAQLRVILVKASDAYTIIEKLEPEVVAGAENYVVDIEAYLNEAFDKLKQAQRTRDPLEADNLANDIIALKDLALIADENIRTIKATEEKAAFDAAVDAALIAKLQGLGLI